MELILDVNEIKNMEVLKLDKSINHNLELKPSQTELTKLINNIIDKGSDYVIKALPMNEHIKDILIDVKKAFKTKDFKQILKTAISSSIREGIEILQVPIDIAKDLNKLKDIAIKGGLKQAINASIDIIAKKYIKGNLMGDIISDFFDKMKNYVRSNAFETKLDNGINKILTKTVPKMNTVSV